MKPTRTKHKPFISIIAVLLIAFGFTGCMSPVPVDPAFRQNRSAKVAVIAMAAPKAKVIHQGGQGIIDYAINQATASGRNKRLEDYPSQAKINEVANRFAKRLGSLGYKATVVGVNPTHKEFNQYAFKATARKPLPGADTYLKGQDAVVVVDMPMVGQSQLTYAFVPLSTRRCTAMMTGSMFSVPDGKRLWRSPLQIPNYMSDESVEGGRSDMENVFRALDRAVEKKAAALENDFFAGF